MASILWAKDEKQQKIGVIMLDADKDSMVALPPKPPGEAFDLRSVVDGVGYRQVPKSSGGADYQIEVQGEQITMGLDVPSTADVSWRLVVNGQETDSQEASISPSDETLVRQIP